MDLLLFAAMTRTGCGQCSTVAPPKRLMNGYVMRTTFAVCHEVRSVEASAITVPIGSPIGNTVAHIVDADGNPCQRRLPASCCSVRVGVRLLNRESLSAERFIEHPEFGR